MADDWKAHDVARSTRIEVLFPRPFTNSAPCAHDGPFPEGSAFYCPVCHASGLDAILGPPTPLPPDPPRDDPEPGPVALTRDDLIALAWDYRPLWHALPAEARAWLIAAGVPIADDPGRDDGDGAAAEAA